MVQLPLAEMLNINMAIYCCDIHAADTDIQVLQTDKAREEATEEEKRQTLLRPINSSIWL